MFYTIKCAHCGTIQVTQSLKRFICKFCSRSTTIHKEYILAQLSTGREAAQFVRAYNETKNNS